MAGKPSSRLNNRAKENALKNIQVSKILKRLMSHTVADKDIMTTSQINAAKILLNKCIPDLRSVEMDLSSEDGSMSPKEITITLVEPNEKK